MLRISRSSHGRTIVVVLVLIASVFGIAGVARAASPYWQLLTPNNTSVVYSWPNWVKMQYLWNVYQLENDGTNTYDWFVVYSEVTAISGASAGYSAVGTICFPNPIGCRDFGESQAVGSSIRVDISAAQSLAEAFYGAPQPDTTQGSTTVTASVGVQAGQDTSVSASYSISYTLPDVLVTRYYNPQNIGSNAASYVLWSNSASFGSLSATSSWTVRTLSLIQVKQGYGLQGTITFGASGEAQCWNLYPCLIPYYVTSTFSAPSIAINLGSSAPVASFVATYPSPLLIGQSASFDGTSSYDADGDPILSYNWQFPGASATGATTSHAFGSAGPQTVQLTVSDGYYTGSLSQTIMVYAASVGGYVLTSTGAALGGATVTIKDSAGTTHTATTDATGHYLVALGVAGLTTVTASAKDYVTQSFTTTLSAGQALTQTFNLNPTPPDFTLSNCGGYSTFTNSGGSCTVTATSVGKWTGTISLTAVLSPKITGGAYISAGSTATLTLTADGTGSFVVSFQTGSTATTYTVTVTGTSGGLTHTTSFNIYVSNPPPPPKCPPVCKT